MKLSWAKPKNRAQNKILGKVIITISVRVVKGGRAQKNNFTCPAILSQLQLDSRAFCGQVNKVRERGWTYI